MDGMYLFLYRIQLLGLLLFQLAIQPNLIGREIIFSEDFSSYRNGTKNGVQTNGYWNSTAFDCDDGGLINAPGPTGNLWGVFDNVFVVSDIEGQCCAGGLSGDNRSFVQFNIDISAYCEVAFSLLIYGSGGLECDPNAIEPDFECSSSEDHDQAVVEYAVGNDTTRAAYICGSQGTGGIQVSNISGDSLKILIYISTKNDNEFYALDNIIVTGDPPPALDSPPPVVSCAEYILPTITGEHLSGNQAYYSEPGGQGNIFSPGMSITNSETLYLYDEINACSDQDTLYIIIEPNLQIDSPGDQQTCQQFVLPPITGIGLSGQQAYYTGPGGTGEELFPGAIITDSQLLYIYDTPRNCQDEVFFIVTIDIPPTVNYTVSPPTCYDQTDGGINLQIDGIPPFNIDWPGDNLDGQDQVSGLQAGSYSVTITDGNLCNTPLTITLLQPPPLSLTCSVLRPALTPTGNEGSLRLGFPVERRPIESNGQGRSMAYK